MKYYKNHIAFLLMLFFIASQMYFTLHCVFEHHDFNFQKRNITANKKHNVLSSKDVSFNDNCHCPICDQHEIIKLHLPHDFTITFTFLFNYKRLKTNALSVCKNIVLNFFLRAPPLALYK